MPLCPLQWNQGGSCTAAHKEKRPFLLSITRRVIVHSHGTAAEALRWGKLQARTWPGDAQGFALKENEKMWGSVDAEERVRGLLIIGWRQGCACISTTLPELCMNAQGTDFKRLSSCLRSTPNYKESRKINGNQSKFRLLMTRSSAQPLKSNVMLRCVMFLWTGRNHFLSTEGHPQWRKCASS